jgi:hypothetical protein
MVFLLIVKELVLVVETGCFIFGPRTEYCMYDLGEWLLPRVKLD